MTRGDEAARGSRLGSCERPLCEAYDAALYDLDGVLYLGADPVPHAAESVALATSSGMRKAFVTNNASRPPAVVAEHLTALGIPADAADVVTSAQATARMLSAQLPEGATVLVVGAEGLVQEVRAAGFVVVDADEPAVQAVAQGYGPNTGIAELSEAALALRRGVLWIAANTDGTLPSPRGPVPGNGALVAALRVATGREPQVAGKPEPALHVESVARVRAVRPLVVGDRIDTDILGAICGGADSLLVLTGVTDVWDALTAADGTRPTYIAWDLRGITAPQPPVVVSDATARCDSATASYDDGQLAVTGEGVAALRAACALAWAGADEGRPLTGVTGLEQ